MELTKEQIKKLRHSFHCQKGGAKFRGIEWQLTFEQWLEWWGDDVFKRGQGKDALQMQRYGDKGPYSIGNIKKGTPKQNVATWVNVLKNKRADKAKRDHEAMLDALMFANSREDHDPMIYDDDIAHHHKNGSATFSSFTCDK